MPVLGELGRVGTRCERPGAALAGTLCLLVEFWRVARETAATSNQAGHTGLD